MAKWKKSIAGDRNVNTNIEAEIEMETTLEVRWFFPGMPPAVVQRWFELDLPGKSLTTETRTDWYANLKHDDSAWLDNFSSRILNSEEVKLARPKGYRFAYAFGEETSPSSLVNFKLRQGNLELKLRQQSSTYKFDRPHSRTSLGEVEQWYKFDSQQLKESIPIDWLRDRKWIGVDKERTQKLDRDVASELTWLKVNRECWWTIAFEMSQGERAGRDSCFRKVLDRACQSYRGPELSATNSYGYSRWLLGLTPTIVSERKLKIDSIKTRF